MAKPTKRKTKHRGNAAGIVEVRGRTGRRPTATEKGQAGKPEPRVSRLDKPPTWQGSITRAVIASVVVLVVSTVALKKQTPVHMAELVGLLLVLYVPLGYYTDRTMYQRRLRKRQAGGGK